MAIQMGDTVRNARLDQIETTVGASPLLEIRTGAPPANCAAADSGSLLIQLALPADWMANAGGGTKAKTATAWTGAASGGAGATPGHFRLWDNGRAVCHMQGTCAIGSGDINFNGTITSGQTVTVTAFTLTEGNP